MEVVGDELAYLDPRRPGAPGARQGVGFHYEVRAEFTASQMDCFGSHDYPRIIGGRFEAGLLQLEWPQHIPSCVVFACHESRTCELPEEGTHWHHSDMFFSTVSAPVFALGDGSLGGREELWVYRAEDGSLQRVALVGTLRLLDQH